MKKILLLFLLLIITPIPNQTVSAQTSDPNQDAKTQVVIIGTIHSAHYKNPNYSPEKLKEIILSLRPDAILNELPLSQIDPNGRPLFRDKQKHPEGWAADTVAQQLGIRQIPFDRPDRQENFRKTKYFEKQRQSEALRKKCGECLSQNEPNSINVKIAQLQQFACQAEASLMLNAEPEVINSEANDSIKRIKKSLWYEIVHELVEKYPECDGLIEYDHFFRDQWNIRNKIMADNIIKAAKKYPGKRLVVITGATHRYILRDLLKDNPNIELKEYWEVKNMCNSKTEINAGFAYYSTQGDISNPGKYASMYEDIPADVNQLCEIVQGSLIHLFHAHRYGVTLTDEQKKEVQLRSVEEMLEHIHKSDERPIRFTREPGKRLVGNCRHFAVLLCSMLRHKNIPARARCGFASYFPLGYKYDDHWICEYWNESQAQWVRVDAQLDPVQLEQMHIDINPLDLPKGAFLPAGTAWQMCKAGKEDPNRFGFADMKGMWFISGNVVRDFMALNKVELLPWDNMDLMIGPKERSTSEKEVMINHLAELSNSPQNNFERIRDLYQKDIRFSVGKGNL